MPETRYVEIYENGTLKSSEPYQMTDAELEMENAQETIGELAARAEGELTLPEAARFLKALARLGAGR